MTDDHNQKRYDLEDRTFEFARRVRAFIKLVLQSPDVPSKLAGLGLVLVEGPNDVIRLDTLGVPAVALCSNAITREQVDKAAQLALRSRPARCDDDDARSIREPHFGVD